jgi:hypothetical protein
MKTYIIVVLAALLSACGMLESGPKGLRGSENVATEGRSVTGFKQVRASKGVNLVIDIRPEHSVAVVAEDNIIPYVKTEVQGDTLIVETTESISPTVAIDVRISTPELTSIDVSGASTADVTGFKGDSLNVNATGASTVRVAGETGTFTAELNGASEVIAGDLKAKNVTLKAEGASRAGVFASQRADLTASGASSITIDGNPPGFTQNSSGASTIKKKE